MEKDYSNIEEDWVLTANDKSLRSSSHKRDPASRPLASFLSAPGTLVCENQKSLPHGIETQTQLRSLFLKGNSVRRLPPAFLVHLKELTQLDLSSNGLVELPPSISALSRLRLFSAKDNRICHLPREIASLTSLHHLSLDRNTLVALPESISSLSNLLSLTLSRNLQLSALPSDIGALSSLKLVDVSGCSLRTLPSSLVHVTSLTTLGLAGCPLSHLPLTLINLRGAHKLFSLPQLLSLMGFVMPGKLQRRHDKLWKFLWLRGIVVRFHFLRLLLLVARDRRDALRPRDPTHAASHAVSFLAALPSDLFRVIISFFPDTEFQLTVRQRRAVFSFAAAHLDSVEEQIRHKEKIRIVIPPPPPYVVPPSMSAV